MNGYRLDETDFAHAGYRANRTVVESLNPTMAASFTVFVGLYNAEPYFDHLIEQIEAQQGSSPRWIFVENDSSDDTWSRVSAWASAGVRDVTLVRNGFNLGATGSIFVNLDLVTTEWVTFIHQDDIYAPNHLVTLEKAALAADPNTVGVFSDMGRADSDGRPVGSFPPPIWFVPDLDPPTLFLSLLRNHCIPWPVLGLRTRELRQTEAPWHSTAFPDTEITMRLTSRGRFVHIPQETMRYRDNLRSESRSIDDRERKFGATLSLFRVFASGEFSALALAIPVDDRNAFVIGLKNAITVRLGDTDRGNLVTAAAIERLEQVWDNRNAEGLSELASIYGDLGAGATSSLLDRMSHAAGGPKTSTPVAPLPASEARIEASSSITVPRAVVRLYERFGPLIPYRIRRLAARVIISAATKSDPLSAWRFVWR